MGGEQALAVRGRVELVGMACLLNKRRGSQCTARLACIARMGFVRPHSP